MLSKIRNGVYYCNGCEALTAFYWQGGWILKYTRKYGSVRLMLYKLGAAVQKSVNGKATSNVKHDCEIQRSD